MCCEKCVLVLQCFEDSKIVSIATLSSGSMGVPLEIVPLIKWRTSLVAAIRTTDSQSFLMFRSMRLRLQESAKPVKLCLRYLVRRKVC